MRLCIVRRYADSREEAAFAALVRRYGPTVLRVCYRVLHNSHDAEDAFQSTFQVLAGEAVSLRRRGAVGAWIHEVAYHAALRVRQRTARQRRHEEQHVPLQKNDGPEEGILRQDVQAALYEELHRLPEKYRAPLVLCNLLGRTQEAAARELGLHRTALNKRLKRAYNMLRQRLLARGITLSMLLLVSLLHAEGSTAPLSAELLLRTVRGVMGTAPGSTVAAAVARGVWGFSIGPVKTTHALLAVFLLILGGGAWAVHAWITPSPEHGDTMAVLPPQAVESLKPKRANRMPLWDDQSTTMVLGGTVVDAGGVPVAGAQVAVCGLRSFRHGKRNVRDEVLARGQTDREGHFHLTVRRPALAWSLRTAFVHLWAAAPNHAPATLSLPWRPDPPPVEARLLPPEAIHGRLLDDKDRPAASARILVSHIGAFRLEPVQETTRDSHKGPPLWPAPVTTDANGQFTLHGLNLQHGVSLLVCDDRYALCRVVLEPSRWSGQTGTLRLTSARLLQGRVTAGGAALARARLSVLTRDAAGRALGSALDVRADAAGFFRVRLPDGASYRVEAFAPEGAPYLGMARDVPWPADTTHHDLELALPRGILVHGVVTDTDSGKPVAEAHVQFRPLDAKALPPQVLTGLNSLTMSGADGAFRLVVPKAAGLLVVHERSGDYVTEEWSGRLRGKSGRIYAQRVLSLDADDGAEAREVRVALRRGMSVQGRVVGADGEAVKEGAWLCRGRTYPEKPDEGQPQSFWDGRFTLRGCVPDRVYPVLFLDAHRCQGVLLDLTAKADNTKPVDVRLQPCGAAVARFVDAGGRPVAGYQPVLYVMAPPDRDEEDDEDDQLPAEMHELDEFDPGHYRDGPRTDADGRVTLPALIPGVRYRMNHYLDAGGSWREFEVAAGQTLSLPDVVLHHRH